MKAVEGNSGRQQVGVKQRRYYIYEEVSSSFWELLILKNMTASVLKEYDNIKYINLRTAVETWRWLY